MKDYQNTKGVAEFYNEYASPDQLDRLFNTIENDKIVKDPKFIEYYRGK